MAIARIQRRSNPNQSVVCQANHRADDDQRRRFESGAFSTMSSRVPMTASCSLSSHGESPRQESQGLGHVHQFSNDRRQIVQSHEDHQGIDRGGELAPIHGRFGFDRFVPRDYREGRCEISMRQRDARHRREPPRPSSRRERFQKESRHRQAPPPLLHRVRRQTDRRL